MAHDLTLKALLIGFALSILACAPLRSEAILEYSETKTGIVTGRTAIDLRDGETRGQRAAWAALSLHPVSIAVAAFAVEEGLGWSRVYEYRVKVEGDTELVMVNRDEIEVGECVAVKIPKKEGLAIMIVKPANACKDIRS